AVIPRNDNDQHSADYWKEIGQTPGRSYMVQVGHATKAASGGSTEGFELFDKWRKGAPDYDADRTRKKWEGFKPTKIGFGTLKFYADKAKPGWDHDWVDAEIARLAKLSRVDFDRQHKASAKELGISVALLKALVEEKRNPQGDGGLEDK